MAVGEIPILATKSYVQYPEGYTPVSIYPETEVNKFVVVRPWQAPNCDGEYPGDICCQRATGEFCYEHDKNNY